MIDFDYITSLFMNNLFVLTSFNIFLSAIVSVLVSWFYMKKYKPVVEDHTGRFPHTLSQSDLVGVINEDRRQDFNRIIGYVDSQKFITPVVFETKIKDIDARIDEKFNDNINKIREKINGFDKKLADSIEINDKTHEELINKVNSIKIPDIKPIDTNMFVTNSKLESFMAEINKIMNFLMKKKEIKELGQYLASGIKGKEFIETKAKLKEVKGEIGLMKETEQETKSEPV